jgi:HEAT repeat protein
LYALKNVNPYFTMREWRDDQALGVTDHERRSALADLASQIGDLPTKRQKFWSNHLNKIIENDASPEMRRLAINAAGNLEIAGALEIVEKGLDDDSIKVRMEACRALGKRPEEEALRMLASTAGTETDEDVRQAALDAIGNHNGKLALDALQIALNDRNPATRDLAVQSLRRVTGKDYGDQPDAWIAALQGEPVEEKPTRIVESIRNQLK